MKRILSIIFLAVYTAVFASAQPELPSKCEVFYPDILLSKTILYETEATQLANSSDYGQSKEPKTRKHWMVFSDRSRNTTYTAPDGKKPYGELEFNEKLRIAQIKNGYALVYSEPQEGIEYPKISHLADCRGWVRMSKLLLWHSSPTNELGIYNKALLCVNMDEKVDANTGTLFKNPTDSRDSEQLKTDKNFYFIMKREGDKALLAYTYTLDGTSSKMLLGWVSEQSYVAWNQRSCIEPTWEIEDVEYFADKGIRYRITRDIKGEHGVHSSQFVAKESAGYDEFLYRMNPDELRFPLLDGGTEALYHCSTFGTAEGSDAVASTTDNNGESLLQLSNRNLEELSHINIGIVIDGTSSMENYYPKIKEAIKKSSEFFSEKDKVKVGVVIYRDYMDGEYATEYLPLSSPDNKDLGSWLDAGGRYGVKSHPGDRSLEEAMYMGIDVALTKLRFKKGQSNILLVIGDCGNDPADTRINPDALVDKLVAKDVHLMGFQVRKSSEAAFGLFNTQLLKLMRSSVNKKFAVLKKEAENAGESIENVGFSFAETKDGYELVNDERNNLFIATHCTPKMGQQMSADRLLTQIQTTFQYCAATVEHGKDLHASVALNFQPSEKGSSITIDKATIIQAYGKEWYEKLRQNRSLLTFKGYTKKNHESGRSFYKPVVFMSSDELTALIERLSPVAENAVAVSNDREPYIKALKALVQAMSPADFTNERMEQMTYSEIMNTISGLNAAARSLTESYTLAEIASHEAVDQRTYSGLVAKFSKKFENLREIKRRGYKYMLDFNGIKYYWLPIEELP